MGISGWKQKKEVEQGLHFRRGIKKKLLIGILVPIVVILLVFAGILEKGIGDSMREVQNSSMINQVYSAERQVKAYFDKIFTNQQMVSGMESVERTFMELDSEGSGFRFEDSVNYSRLMQDLRKVQELQGDEVQLSWIAGFANNQVLRSDGDVSDPATFSVKDRPWYQQLQASSGTPVLTGAYADGASDKIVVSAISPVLNKQQKLVGAVGFDISLDEFQRMLKELKIGSTGFVAAYDSEGRVICHPDSSLVMKNVAEIDYSENLKSALSRHENTDILEYQYNGETLYGISHYLDEVGWVFLGSVPRTEYIKEQSNAILFISIAIIICILVLVTLCILVANKILNPIRSISRVAPNLIRGKLEMDLPEAPDDEIGALIRVFGEMAEGLEHIICDISNTLESVVSKDLTAKTTAEYNGDFVRIQTAMYRIIDGTNEIMGAVIRSAEQVSLGSEQVSAGAQGLVQGVADQAGAVEKLSISIEKMTDQIQKMSETAQQASTGAKAVGDQMQLSQEKMDEMQKAMNWIHKTSDEIEKIVKTIEDIAFQTNILALNAAVEAARAGSAGKGFAVVADEVRNLASKSAEASKNTASLIANSMEAVQHGMRLANDTGSALTTAVQGATNVVNQIRSVSNDLSAQSESMGEVALSIDEISNVVLKNSETAEESVEASEELAAQAQELKNLVADFRLKD